MIILKFGGSSVADAKRMVDVAGIIEKTLSHSPELTVVISAIKGATDELLALSEMASKADQAWPERLKALVAKHIEIIKEILPVSSQSSALAQVISTFNELEDLLRGVEILKEASLRTRDLVVSFGERSSAFILSELLLSKGHRAKFIDSRKVLLANSNFGNARVDMDASHQLVASEMSDSKTIYVVTGFIGSTSKSETVTFGRGGSDYTAAVLAELLSAKSIEIWTDVNGFLTADPRKVPKALPLSELSFEEAMELCHFGAKVIYPPTLQPAARRRIPLVIKNTFNPDFQGTNIIYSKVSHKREITGVTSVPKVSLLRLEGNGMVGVTGVSKRLFSSLANIEANVILITQASSEQSISVAVSPSDAIKARAVLVKEFENEIRSGGIKPVLIEDDLSIISVVGENMRHMPGIAGKVFSALGRQGVNISAIAQGSSELSISCVISSHQEAKALQAVHDAFFLSDTVEAHIALIGPGLIGKTLLKQLSTHAASLKESLLLELKLIGLADSKKVLVDPSGIELSKAYERLSSEGQNSNLHSFTHELAQLNLPSVVVADCSASDDVAAIYHNLISKSIGVVTPNKKGQSTTYEQYKNTKELATRKRVPWLYETSVGAGLPVISTLNDLIRSGDQIHSIEGVLSGTLSYIFSSFTSEKKFSELVKDARKAGYTEPDPRDDLNGIDVARKILILAREAGLQVEMSDVLVENLVPEELRKSISADQFLSELEKFDSYFKDKVSAAEKNGKKLRYIAKCDLSEQAASLKVSLVEVDQASPFWSLDGTDNMVAFSSERYKTRPLVVRGPGAGAEVTAAGVFADIIRAVS